MEHFDFEDLILTMYKGFEATNDNTQLPVEKHLEQFYWVMPIGTFHYIKAGMKDPDSNPVIETHVNPTHNRSSWNENIYR